MPLRLLSYEASSLAKLAKQFSLSENFVGAIAESLAGLQELFVDAAGDIDEFRAGRVVIMGLLNHAHHNLAGGMKALEDGNAIVWANCVRGLIEVFGACVLIGEQPGRAVSHLEELSAGKLYAAAERGRPGLKTDLKKLHAIVHPGAGAMYAGFEPIAHSHQKVRIEFGLHPVPKEAGPEPVIVLANLALGIEEKLRALIQDGKVLSVGKQIMVAQVANAGDEVEKSSPLHEQET